MKRMMTALALACLVIAPLSGAQEPESKGTVQEAAEDVQQAASDSAITARIETTYMFDNNLNPLNINTTTRNGVVTLTGAVQDEIQRKLAADIAQSVDGVVKVENKLTVVPTIVSERPRRTWREKIDDMSLEASIRSRLVYHKELKGLKMGVSVERGVVTLFGNVGNHFQHDKIVQVVEETRGVKAVIDNLKVQPRPVDDDDVLTSIGKDMTDEWLEKRVETAIVMNRRIGIRNLGVEVNDNVCILSGTVDADEEKALVESIAMSINGIESVQNNLTIYEPVIVPDAPAGIGLPKLAPETEAP